MSTIPTINFQNTAIRTRIFDNETFIKATDISKALGYKKDNAASGLYRHYVGIVEVKFPDMVQYISSMKQPVEVFKARLNH